MINFGKKKLSAEKPSTEGRKMHQAVCSNCGNKCELPFKPTGDKPVFCSDCYGKSGQAGSRGPKHSPGQFDVLNSKLDKILEMLALVSVAETAPKKNLVKKATVAKKPAKKSVKKPIKKSTLASKKVKPTKKK